MRLIETPEGWRVAWSRMDIFSDLAEGARLERVQTMPNRGNIYDRNGKVLVDQEGRSIVIYLVKQDMASEDACIELLSRVMRRDYRRSANAVHPVLPGNAFPVGELDPETYQLEESEFAPDMRRGRRSTSTRSPARRAAIVANWPRISSAM